MKLICLGDSNTYGYDPRSWLGGRYPADSRWVDILAAKTDWEVLNLGQNGREIPLAYDGVHFTEQGHRAFAQALFETLESLEVLK